MNFGISDTIHNTVDGIPVDEILQSVSSIIVKMNESEVINNE